MPEQQWLVLRFEAPLLAFGGVAIDQIGVTRDFPAASMLTGLMANALGWARTERDAHQDLQDRLVFGARWEWRHNDILTDNQNAQLAKLDRGWTTFGKPEGRHGASYATPHRRRRDYHGDACLSVVLRLEPPENEPDLDAITAALDHPARPLFIGRKPCLPSSNINQGKILAPTVYTALSRLPCNEPQDQWLPALWPLGEGPTDDKVVHRVIDLADMRNWSTGLHGGTRKVVEGAVIPEAVS